MAWFPNVPTMARSINDIVKVELRAMPMGNANLEIVVIRSLVSMKTPLKYIDCFRKRQLAEAEPRRNVIDYESGPESAENFRPGGLSFLDPPTDDRISQATNPTHSARSNIRGLTDSSRCAGIQVASSPSDSITRTTPANTSGSRGVA